MNILNSYIRSKLDLSHIGFQRGEKESGYFCTPVLSRVIGWAGVDGIHFCTTKGFEEMIFAVSPANCPGEYVHPVAKNFEDFLRLLLACNDTAAIEQCRSGGRSGGCACACACACAGGGRSGCS